MLINYSYTICHNGLLQKLAEITGSRAYERFSGPQIAKIARTKPEAYNSTKVYPLHLRLR